MKIVFAIKAMDDIKGGVERVIADISRELAERGHEVVLLSYDKPGGHSFYPLHEKIKRICLGIGASKETTGFLEMLRRLGPTRRALKQERPGIVVAFMHSMFVPVTFSLLGTSIPVIASEHIVPQHYKGKPVEFLLLVLSGLLALRITVLSERIKNLYPSILHRKMVVVPNPVHLPKQTAQPGLAHDDRKIILNIGRLTAQKDQKTLIEAFALLAARYPDWDMRIIGEGVLQKDLENRIKAFGLHGRIILAGTTDKIAEEYLRANIFALSSSYESFGLVTAEAMSYGLPALGFADCPGTNELIMDGENGLLAAGSDRVKSFSGKLEELMKSADLRARLGQNGIKTAAQFAPGHITDIWENLLRNAAAGGGL